MAEEQQRQLLPEGPPMYTNWRAKLHGLEMLCVYEYPLLTDARIIGQAAEGYGPYKFLILTDLGDPACNRREMR